MPLYTPDTTEIGIAIVLILAFCGLIFRFGKLQLCGLPFVVSIGLFLLKCAIAFVFVAIFRHTFEGGDAYRFFYYSQYINQAWHENPTYFFRLLFGANDCFVEPAIYKYAWQLGFWSTDDSYNIERFNALLRCVSGGYYAVHVVIMSFLVYCANLLFYKIIYDILPQKTTIDVRIYYYLAAVLLFLLPSVAFFTSGVHKDGLVYIALSVATFCLYSMSQKNKNKTKIIKNIIGICGSFFLLFLVRKYLFIVFLPSVGIFLWLYCFPKKQIIQYVGLILLYFVLLYFVDTHLYFPILVRIVAEQGHFIAESGGSDFYVPRLQADWHYFAAFSPRALLNGFLQPFIWQTHSIGSFLAALELLSVLVCLSVLCAVLRRHLYAVKTMPLFYFLITYAVGSTFLYGLMVSNAGTLLRYRSISLGLFTFLLLFKLAVAEKNRSKNQRKSE